MNVGMILKLALVLIPVTGASFITVIEQGFGCVKGEDGACTDTLKTFGMALIAPQTKMSEAVDVLKTEGATKEQKTEAKSIIFASSLITLMWIIPTIIITLPLAKIFGSSGLSIIFVWGFVMLLLGFLQSYVGYLISGTFAIPWLGFMKLFVWLIFKS